MINIIKGFEELKKTYRIMKLQGGDHRGINAFKIAGEIGFDQQRIAFDKMDNRFAREVFSSTGGHYWWTLDDLIKEVRTEVAEGLTEIEIDFGVREYTNRYKTDAKERNLGSFTFFQEEPNA